MINLGTKNKVKNENLTQSNGATGNDESENEKSSDVRRWEERWASLT